jgi:hypothetical protein
MAIESTVDLNDPELPYSNDHRNEGTRYRVTAGDNPWGLPVGSELEEVRRGEFWDHAIPWPPTSGDCWVWLRPSVLGAPPERGFIGSRARGVRSRPVQIEKFSEDGVRAWVASWIELHQGPQRSTGVARDGLEK